VLPPTGLPATPAAALASAVADELRRLGVPAAVGIGNRLSATLSAEGRETASRDGVVVDLVWTLRGPEGRTQETRTDAWLTPDADWAAGAPSLIRGIAAETAQSFAVALVGAPPAEAQAVGIGPVAGVPEEGETAFVLALRRGLIAEGVPVTADPAETTARIRGEIAMTPIDAERENVEIAWIVEGADGRPIGRLDQQSLVRPGVLQENWGNAAYFIVQGALPDLIRVIRDRNPRDVYSREGG